MSDKKGQSNKPRRMLSIDGGIRCMIAVEILVALEAKIRDETGDNSQLLCDQFDLIAVTSSGAMVGAAIATGRSMSEVREFVTQNAIHMRKPALWHSRLRSLYDKDAVAGHLQDFFGVDTTLGSDKLKSLLLMVLRN